MRHCPRRFSTDMSRFTQVLGTYEQILKVGARAKTTRPPTSDEINFNSEIRNTTHSIIKKRVKVLCIPPTFFSRESYGNMQIIGHSSFENDDVTRSVLHKVQLASDKPFSVVNLSIRNVNFNNQPIREAFLSLFHQRDRQWEEISFYDCASGGAGAGIGSLVEQVLRHANVLDLTIFAGHVERDVFQALSKWLPQNRSIKTIQIKSRLDDPEHMSLLAAAVAQSQTLQNLELDGSTLSQASAEALSRGLSRNASIQRFRFAQCYATDHMIEVLVRSIQHHPTLRELILYGNQCRAGGLTAISNMLETTPSLQEMDLTWQDINEGHTSELDFSILARGLAQNNTLKTLHLSRNVISPESAEALASVLTQNQTLEHLSLRGCYLECESMKSFAQYLPNMKGLKRLWLHSNKGIGEEGSGTLLEGLKHNVNLVELILSPPVWKCTKEMNHLLDLNWGGGRRLSGASRNEKIPLSLWPCCLERVNRRTLTALPLLSSDTGKSAGERDLSRRADILYFFVREILSEVL